MRSTDEIKELIISTANSDDRIRAVLLNGSRANPKIKPDQFQDFDILFIVKDLDTYTNDHKWTSCFGEQLIEQRPNEMSFGEDEYPNEVTFTYLMLFADGNRIDLTLFPIEKYKTDFEFDSLTVVWLDKDNLFVETLEPTDNDYHIQKPTEKYFIDVCNEFWWVTTYVAKGLLRNEVTYAKEMLETVVRPMFMKVLEWSIGTQTNFSVAFGKSGKFMKQYLPNEQYGKLLATYSDEKIKNNWTALLLMADLFGEFAKQISVTLNFNYNINEEQNVKNI